MSPRSVVPSSRAARVLRRDRHRRLRWWIFWPLVTAVCVVILVAGPSILNPAKPTDLGPATTETRP